MRYLVSIFRFMFYITIGLLFILGGAAFFFMSWEPDRTEYTIRGIDVSHHQDEIDWQAVAADDVRFVYMKATEGGDHNDTRFAENWKKAGEAGLVRGGYHFFTFCKPGLEQAKNFLEVLPKGEPMLPPALDLEYGGNCSERPSAEALQKEMSDFVVEVESVTGHEVVIYTTRDAYEDYLEGQGLTRKLWARSIVRSPSYGKDWLFWQYHARGSVKGISGHVDLNVLSPEIRLEQIVK